MDPEPESFLVAIQQNWSLIAGLLSLLGLLIVSGIISGTEVAFFSLTKSDLDQTDEPEASLVAELLTKPKKLLATILISNNFINILFILIFAYVGDYLFEGIESKIVKFVIEILLVTFLILLFGEVLPKVYANRNPYEFAAFMARPMSFLTRFLTFLSIPLMQLTGLVEKKLGKKPSDLSVEVLSQALELTSSGATTKEEKRILQGIVNFGNTETSQIMCPRMDIFALSSEEPFAEITDKIVKKGHSRIPVYEESIDKIIGILYTKDLLPHLNKKSFQWKKIIREAFFVPENKKLDDLLKEFQEMKNHLAIVVDEYGGTSGLITLEDIIEEIVGDEFDQEDLSYSKLDDLNYVFEGKTTLKDLLKVLQLSEEVLNLEEMEAETLAGLILEVTGKFPKKGEIVRYRGYRFLIEAVDKKRIKQVKITLPKTSRA